MRVCLWDWPPGDGAEWRALVGSELSHTDYQTLLSAVQADLERMGQAVTRVRMTAAEMRTALDSHGWENTPDNRAAVLAARGG